MIWLVGSGVVARVVTNVFIAAVSAALPVLLHLAVHLNLNKFEHVGNLYGISAHFFKHEVYLKSRKTIKYTSRTPKRRCPACSPSKMTTRTVLSGFFGAIFVSF